MLCTHAAWPLASATSAKTGAPGAATAARKAWRTASAKSSSRCGPASTARGPTNSPHSHPNRQWIIYSALSLHLLQRGHRNLIEGSHLHSMVTSDATERFVHKTFGLKMNMLESQ
jgi:hypothetical protein